MIQSLSIKNFQSHKDTYLEFDSGVNIITGPSDSGKTAILRALRWLIWNRPSGDSMRSKWGGGIFVEAKFDGGNVIRSKDKTDIYQLYISKKALDFKAFRTDVPKEITDFLNISEINLQRQLDAPFLLNNSPGEVAQHFNYVAGLDKIDKVTYIINSQIRELTSSIKSFEEQKTRLENELKTFDYLDKFEAEVEVLEELNNRCINLINKENKLFSLINEIKNKEAEIEESSHLLKLETSVNNILCLYNELNTKDEAIKKLDKLIELYYELETKISMTNHEIDELENEFIEKFPDICPLCGKPK